MYNIYYYFFILLLIALLAGFMNDIFSVLYFLLAPKLVGLSTYELWASADIFARTVQRMSIPTLKAVAMPSNIF